MTILFLTPTYKPAYVYGGVTVVTSLLAESLVKAGHDVTVYTTNGNGSSELKVKTGEEILVDGVKVIYFKRYAGGHSHLSPGFWAKTLFNVHHFDIVHIHSWWSPTIIIAAAICKLRGRIPVLSPHGMFCDYVLNTNNKYKKQLLHAVVGRSILLNTFLHVSTDMEWKESQAFLKANWTGCIIPNLIESGKNLSPAKKESGAPLIIGFLSRIDRKKGLDVLISALAEVNFDFRLKIAGSGDQQYIAYLKELSKKKNISHKVEWVGWKDNIAKYQFYRSVDLLALISHNENFGVVVLEALSVGTPVLLSTGVGLSKYVEDNRLGWVLSMSEIENITQVLEIINDQPQERCRIGENAPYLIDRDYNTQKITECYLDFYSRVVENPLPESEILL